MTTMKTNLVPAFPQCSATMMVAVKPRGASPDLANHRIATLEFAGWFRVDAHTGDGQMRRLEPGARLELRRPTLPTGRVEDAYELVIRDRHNPGDAVTVVLDGLNAARLVEKFQKEVAPT